MEEAELLDDEFATMKNGKIEMEIDIDD